MKSFGKFCMVILILIVAIIVLGGVLFQIYWKWFIVSIFNVKELTLIQSIGLSFIITAINKTTNREKEENKEIDNILKDFLFALLYPIGLFIVAYIIHLFY